MTVRSIRADGARKLLPRGAGGAEGNLRVGKPGHNGGTGRRANQEGIVGGHLHRQAFERLGSPVADEQFHLDTFSRIRNAVPVPEGAVLDGIIGDLDRGLSLIPGPEDPILAAVQHISPLIAPNARAPLETNPIPTTPLRRIVHQREDHRIIYEPIYVKPPIDDQLGAVRIGSFPATIFGRERHHRARLEDQRRPPLHDDVPAHVDPAAPHRPSRDVSLPFGKRNIHHHIHPASPDRLDEQSRGSRTGSFLEIYAVGIGVRRERRESHAVEGIRGVPQVAVVPGAIRFVVCPEIQIVCSGIGAGHRAVRIPHIVEASIRTLQV